jgi:HSP20 family protein
MKAANELADVPLNKTTELKGQLDLDPKRADIIQMATLHRGDEAVIRVQLPGLDPDCDVDLSMDQEYLHISAKTGGPEIRARGRWNLEDVLSDGFHQTIQLPKGIDPDCVSATYQGGFLEIRFPCSWAPR